MSNMGSKQIGELAGRPFQPMVGAGYEIGGEVRSHAGFQFCARHQFAGDQPQGLAWCNRLAAAKSLWC